MAKPFVAVLMGSDSALPIMEGAIKTLKSLGVAVEARVTSAHRTPEATHAYVKDAEQRGCGVPPPGQPPQEGRTGRVCRPRR